MSATETWRLAAARPRAPYTARKVGYSLVRGRCSRSFGDSCRLRTRRTGHEQDLERLPTLAQTDRVASVLSRDAITRDEPQAREEDTERKGEAQRGYLVFMRGLAGTIPDCSLLACPEFDNVQLTLLHALTA